jgi:hypothetical protein
MNQPPAAPRKIHPIANLRGRLDDKYLKAAIASYRRASKRPFGGTPIEPSGRNARYQGGMA